MKMEHKRPQTHNHKTREDVILVIRCWYLRQDKNILGRKRQRNKNGKETTQMRETVTRHDKIVTRHDKIVQKSMKIFLAK